MGTIGKEYDLFIQIARKQINSHFSLIEWTSSEEYWNKDTIGDGCLFGANAAVTHDIPACSVAAGVHAKVIKQI